MAPASATGKGGKGGKKDDTKHGKGNKGNNSGQGDQPDLPSVDGDVPPGSVLSPGGGLIPDPAQTGSSNPLQALTDGLTGGGKKPTSGPSVPIASDLLNGVDELLHGVVDPLTGQTE